MAFRWTNGASAWRLEPVIQLEHRSQEVVRQTHPQQYMQSVNGTNGCANTHLQVLPATTSTNHFRRFHKATWHNRFSGIPRLPLLWLHPRVKVTTQWMTKVFHYGKWRRHHTGRTGLMDKNLDTRMLVLGHCSSPRRLTAEKQRGCMRSLPYQKPCH